LIEGTMLVGLHTTWSAPQAKNPSYAHDMLNIPASNVMVKERAKNEDFFQY